ncbi:hypothetical protein [Shouchella miscanthi]|uniref:Uncharacterized protein n=1 Tax=Shouchella miscanthi TaxID=2598861 RepID=A0ABU6NE91_9BACI|nr:hypothetical protein [Shouchella miscanthi]
MNEKLYLEIGATKITIIPPTDPGVINKAHGDFHRVSWEIWKSFSFEEQKELNETYREK